MEKKSITKELGISKDKLTYIADYLLKFEENVNKGKIKLNSLDIINYFLKADLSKKEAILMTVKFYESLLINLGGLE